MFETFRLATITVLSIYALGSTPIVMFFGFRSMFNLLVAVKSRAAGASWLAPGTWLAPGGYTRDGHEHLVDGGFDIIKALLVLVPWGALLYLASL